MRFTALTPCIFGSVALSADPGKPCHVARRPGFSGPAPANTGVEWKFAAYRGEPTRSQSRPRHLSLLARAEFEATAEAAVPASVRRSAQVVRGQLEQPEATLRPSHASGFEYEGSAKEFVEAL